MEENQYVNNYSCFMADKDVGPIMRKIFGVRYSKVAYILGHAMGSIVLCLVGFVCYH